MDKRILKILGVSNQKVTYIKLVKGVVKRNPHVKVLCPRLAEGDCQRGKKTKTGTPYRPQLLVKNHGDPDFSYGSAKVAKTNFF